MIDKKIISVSEYEIYPNTEKDYTEQLNSLFEKCGDGAVYSFESGTYNFYASCGKKYSYSLSNSEPIPQQTLSLLLKNKNNITLEGNGAVFLYHGHVQPISLDNCSSITLQNFTIDWKKPLVSEGIITAVTPDYLELSIDQQLFPCFVRNFCLYFDIGDDEISELTYGGHTLYSKTTLTVIPNSADILHIKNVEHIAGDRFRFYLSDILCKNTPVAAGDILVLRHNRRIHTGIFAEHCTDIIYDKVTVHSCGGIGMLFQFCENIECRRLQFTANRKAGRLIACTRDDGMQFSNCCGKITVDECCFHGLQDSPIDIHSTSVCVHKIIDERTLECEYVNAHTRNFLYWAENEHRIRFINRKNMTSQGEAVVDMYRLISEERFLLRFTEPLPSVFHENPLNILALENITNTPAVEIYRSYFGSGRSRGILVTTPKPVVIEDNLFASAGAAILIAGDASYWFESGQCRDVAIRHNTFTDDCALSGYENSHAVITICPAVPKPHSEYPYHSNIKIYENTFHSAETTVVHAFSVDNLSIRDNIIYHSERINYMRSSKSLFFIMNCKNAELQNNTIVGNFLLKELENDKSDLLQSTSHT